MNIRHVFRILSVIVMVLMTLAVTGPAYANTHYNYIIPLDDNTIYKAGDSPNTCIFDITVHSYGSIHVNYWLDDNGNLIRELDSAGTLRQDLSYHGKTVTAHIQGPVHLDFRNNTYIISVTGVQAIITIPHYGKVYGGGGQVIWTPEGRVDIGNMQWDWSPICAYLGS